MLSSDPPTDGKTPCASAASPSDSPAQPEVAGAHSPARRDRPCDACRRRKTRCVASTSGEACGFCKLRNKECTYVEKPAPRKRKSKDESTGPRLRQARILSSSRDTTFFQPPECRIYGANEGPLTPPISETSLDWCSKSDAVGQCVAAQSFSLGDASGAGMAWHVPACLQGDAKADGMAYQMWVAWASLLRRQSSAVLPDKQGAALQQVFDMSKLSREEREEQSAEHETDAQIFQQMALLSRILSKLLDVFPVEPPNTSDPQQDPTRVALAKAKPIQIALKEWYGALPVELRMDATDGSVSGKPSLHLAYFAVEVQLHTCIISSLSALTTAPELAAICRHAAKSRLLSAMDFTNRLRPAQLQSSVWHQPAAANFCAIGFFADLLRRSAPDAEEMQWYEQRLREFRWTLGVSARNAAWLDPVVALVDETLEQPSH